MVFRFLTYLCITKNTIMKIKIGTRASKLALWQAYYIAHLLEEGGVDTEIVKIETKGDKILDKSIAKIGSKGVFTEELEEKLRKFDIDIAVHSAKDMQSSLPDDLEIIAFTPREIVNDVLVSENKDWTLEKLNEAKGIVGTSSTRRVATLKHFYPNIQTKDIRGNLQTRLRKMQEENYDAIILAYAGVKRMENDDLIRQNLDLEEFTPAVGQGSVAIEISKFLEKSKKNAIEELCNNKEVSICLRAERAYLKTLEGGCSIPVFALAEIHDNKLKIKGGIISLDGKERIHKTLTASIEQPEHLGKMLAEFVLDSGGKEILADIKTKID